MINFSRKEDVLPSSLIVLSVLLLAATLAYMLLAPKPSTAATSRNGASRRRMVDDIADTRRQARQTRAAVLPRLWQGNPEAVTGRILAQMTTLTGKNSLKLLAFRPGRSQVFDEVTELRFDAQLSGSYAKLHALMDALDAPGSKIALRSVQMTSSQAAGNTVSATLGLSAFVATDPTLVSVPPKKAADGTNQH